MDAEGPPARGDIEKLIEDTQRQRLTRRQFALRATGLGLSLSALGPALAACGGGGGGKKSGKAIELTVWHQENFPEVIKGWGQVFAHFNATHPNVKVKQQVNDWQDVYAKLTSAISTHSQPDLSFTIPDHTVTIKQTGAVKPVDDIFDELNKSHGFIDTYVTPYHYDGHMWAVPAFGLHHVLWYDRRKLKAAGKSPPQTWADLLDAAGAMTNGNTHGMGLPASTHLYTDQCLYDFMITDRDADIFAPDGSLRFDNPKTVKALDFYRSLYKYSPRDSTGWGFAEPVGSFVNGSCAMVFHMAHFFNFWEKAKNPPAALGAGPVPQPPGGERGNVSYSNGILLLTDDPDRKEAVKTFLDWLYRPDTMGRWLTAGIPGLYLPVTNDVSQPGSTFWKNPLISKYHSIAKFAIDSAKYGKLYGFNGGTPNPNIGKISSQNMFSKVVQRVVINNQDPAGAAAWGQQQMQSAIS